MNNLTDPVVSVVIPFYNSTSFVVKAISYLKKQTFSSFEVIFVDDGSEEVDYLSINKEIGNDDRFALLKQKHQGAGVARNYGFKNIKGKYVIFLDSDDIYNKDLLKKLITSAKETDADVVLCDAILQESENFHILRTGHLKSKEVAPEQIYEELFQITTPVPWNKLIKASLIRKFDLKFSALHNANDLTFSYSALSIAKKISFVNEPLIEYTVNPNSLQRTKEKNPANIVIAIQELYENLNRFGNFSFLEKTFLKLVKDNINYNIQTLKTIEARKLLLKKFVNSSLYRNYLNPQKSFFIEDDREFINKIEILRTTFLQEKKIEKIDSIERRTKFSIIISFYNDENFISLPIKSLKRQTSDDFIAILIDDGSTDNSFEIAKNETRDDPRFVLFRQTNQGLSVARNFGLSIANSDYVLFLDSDDALEPNTLQRIESITKPNSPDVVMFEARTRNLFSSDNSFGNERTIELSKYLARKGQYSQLMKGPEVMMEAVKYGEFIAPVGLTACKLSFLRENKIKFIENIIHEDNPFTFSLLLYAQRISILKEKLYVRTVRPGSITSTLSSMKNVWGYIQGFWATQNLLIKFREKNSLSEDEIYSFERISFNLLESARKLWNKVDRFQIFFLFLPKDLNFLLHQSLNAVDSQAYGMSLSPKEISLIKFKRASVRRFGLLRKKFILFLKKIY